MPVLGNSSRFGAPPPPVPRHVVYNADSLTAAQSRSAAMGSRVISFTLGTAAILLAIVALTMSWAFTSSLAVSWGEVIKLGLIGSAIVAAMSGLPVAAAMLSRSYPQEARHCMRAWVVALLVVSLAAVVFTWRLERPSDKAAPARLVAAPLAAPAVKSLYMTPALWKQSSACTAPRTLYHEEICREYRQTLAERGVSEDRAVAAETVPSDWSPASTLGITAIADGAARQGLVLVLMLIATAGSGILGRWATLATAESYRLGEGQASALPQPAAVASLPVGPAPSITGPQEAFDMWASGRLQPDPVGEVAGDAAYRDYAETMRLNNLSAMSPNRFGSLLTRFAESSAGRVMKLKSNGVQVYRGVRLPDGAGGM